MGLARELCTAVDKREAELCSLEGKSEHKRITLELGRLYHEIDTPKALEELGCANFKDVCNKRLKENAGALTYSRCNQILVGYRAHLWCLEMLGETGGESGIHHDGLVSLSDTEILHRYRKQLPKKALVEIARDLYTRDIHRKGLLEAINRALKELKGSKEDNGTEQDSADGNGDKITGGDEQGIEAANGEGPAKQKISVKIAPKKTKLKQIRDWNDDDGADKDQESDDSRSDVNGCDPFETMHDLVKNLEALHRWLKNAPSREMEKYMDAEGRSARMMLAGYLTRVCAVRRKLNRSTLGLGDRFKVWVGPDPMPTTKRKLGWVTSR